MPLDKKNLISRLIEFGEEAEKKGLIWGNSGNISHRLDDDKFIVSGSGAHLGKLTEKDLVIFHLENEDWKGKATPSIEAKMHSAIYRVKKNVKSVFHSQPFFTTLISCMSGKVDNRLFPESMAYIDKIGRIPYLHPGSQELAEMVSEKIKDCDVLILGNHGAICAAENLEDVLLKTETLELLCKMIMFSRVGDIHLNYLPQKVKDEFLDHLKKLK